MIEEVGSVGASLRHGGWPILIFSSGRKYITGCPTLRGFRRVGTMLPAATGFWWVANLVGARRCCSLCHIPNRQFSLRGSVHQHLFRGRDRCQTGGIGGAEGVKTGAAGRIVPTLRNPRRVGQPTDRSCTKIRLGQPPPALLSGRWKLVARSVWFVPDFRRRDLGWNLDLYIYPKNLPNALHANLQIFLTNGIEGFPQQGLARRWSGPALLQLTPKCFFAEGVLTEVKFQIPHVHRTVELLAPRERSPQVGVKSLSTYFQFFRSSADRQALFIQHSPECRRKSITDFIHDSLPAIRQVWLDIAA